MIKNFDDPHDKRLSKARSQFLVNKRPAECEFHEINPKYDGIKNFNVGPGGLGIKELMKIKNQDEKIASGLKRNFYTKKMSALAA